MSVTRVIRFAGKEDAAAILKIYETYILNTAVTFEIEVPTVEAFVARMEAVTTQFPWLVYEGLQKNYEFSLFFRHLVLKNSNWGVREKNFFILPRNWMNGYMIIYMTRRLPV